MNYTNELIDAFKKARNLSSDYAAAKALDTTQQTLSNYRRGVSHADDRICTVIAEALELDPFNTIARVNIDRARTDKERDFWRVRTTAAAAVLIAVFCTSYTKSSSAVPQAREYSDRVYIM